MALNLKKTLGGAILASIIVGSAALAAAPAASAATVDTGLTAKTAVQGDRLVGKFITRTSPFDNLSGAANSWSAWDSTAKKSAMANQPGKTAPALNAAVWSFPAVGTTGPIMNELGQCLVKGPPVSTYTSLVPGDCSKAVTASIDPDGVIRVNGQYISDLSNGNALVVSNESGVVVPVQRSQAETLDLSSFTLVPVQPADCTAGLSATVSNVTTTPTAKSAVVSGAGKAGATITVTGSPTGAVTTVVPANGNWSVTVPGLASGDNGLTVTSSDNCAPVNLSVIIDDLAIPVMHPAAAAGAAVLGLGVLGFGGLLRRRATARA